MTDLRSGSSSQTAALPPDYPGKTAMFPPSVTRLIYGIFGVQSRAAGAGGGYAADLEAHFARSGGPLAAEHLAYVDPEGAHCDVYLALWTDRERHERWMAGREFRGWWNALPLTGPVGVWREIIHADKDYYQYGAGVPEKGGMSTLGELVACDKFGYWGGYRDRVPASTRDDFAPELKAMPERIVRDTLGKRLRVHTPDNLCFIREGQGWDKAGPEERRIWEEKMESVVARWVSTLRDNPADTGCLSLRFCRELDYRTKAVLEKQSQIAFLLSLAHIERAARTTPTHLSVRKTFTDMYTEPKFAPHMHVWVEMLIVKRGQLINEYVHCHPTTGLLPYFEPSEVG
jgi:aliphatic aldoxime dehydratase